MKRAIDQKLRAWKNESDRKPLIVRGARQVGKTYSLKKFGRENFDNYLLLDFEKERSLARIFEGDLSPEKIIPQLELHTGNKIVPGETLLFMDEIQECERALLSLRYFYEELPELHVIAAGSLLAFALETISFPVGRVSFEWMFPMTFKEFLAASGKEMLAATIPDIKNFKPVPPSVHELIMEQLRNYFIIGGMPEAVREFVETRSFLKIPKIHKEILFSYLQSLAQYRKRADMESLDHVMRAVPGYVGRQIKYTTLDPDRRIEKTKNALQILQKALIVYKVRASDPNGLPLGAGASSRIFKALFLDIGLLQTASGIDPNAVLREKDLSKIYKGALVEQFVGQELLAGGGSENGQLYYWSRRKKNSAAEVDYLIVRNGKIYPIEVKSGPAGTLKSMHIYLKEIETADIGYVLSPVSHERQRIDKLLFLPFYVDLSC